MDVGRYQSNGVPTSSGSQLAHNAQDNIINKKPTASTNDSRMTAENAISTSEITLNEY